MTQKPVSHAMTRRDLLQTGAVAPLGMAAFSQSVGADEPAGRSIAGNQGIVRGINPRNVVDEYASRDLDAVSDAGLYRQSAEIISRPGRRSNSFTIHAPLELMARYGLLPLVAPKERSLARLQIVATASAYDAGVKPVAAPEKIQPFPSMAAARTEFTTAFRAGDAPSLESLVLAIAEQFGTTSLVHLVTPLALPTLTGAAHSHIGLWLLLRHGTAADPSDAGLLRSAARSLARNPNLRLTSFDSMNITSGKPLKMSPAEIEKEILEKLADPPKGRQDGASIQRLLEAGERTGNAEALFGDFIRRDLSWEQIDAAYRAVLRVCAHCMLQDSLEKAKFGWSHCLTLPQAACGLSSMNMHRKLGLAATLAWTVARRSIESNQALDFSWAPEKLRERISLSEALHTSPQVAAARVWHAENNELPDIRRVLATQASIRNDQHLVKYTRACFDMISFDPFHTRLYLSAAAHLCGLWIGERPRGKIYDNLLLRRNTP